MFTLTKKRLPTQFLMAQYSELKNQFTENAAPFSKEEDLKLVELVEMYGMKWMKIAEFFENRGPIKLKNRYYGHIVRKNLLESLKEELSKSKNLNQAEMEFSEKFEFIDY